MSRTSKRIISWVTGAVLAVSLFGCSKPAAEEVPSSPPATAEQGFDGAGMTVDTITANLMEMQIPSGIRIPEDTLVTRAEPSMIMMAEKDPAAVIEAVESSAKQAGYEVYGEVDNGKVFVGNGNAVLFTATPRAQTLTWGPEQMKDLLVGG